MNSFVHLHTHSHYSLLDATCTIKGLVAKAKEHNMSSLALTDHGNLFGAIEFYNECRKAGINPIIGCELYVSVKDHKEKSLIRGEKHYHHLIVLARNSNGYKNLLKIVSISYLEGFYYRPRVDKKTLTKYSKDLISLSACLGGEIPSLIMRDKVDEAIKVTKGYKEIFGEDSFYLELQDHGIDKQSKVNEVLFTIAEETNTKLVATNDIHYLNKEDREAHDVLLCIGSQNKVTDEKRKRYYGEQYYFKSTEEMHEVFKDERYAKALENTEKIASCCNIELEFKQSLPKIEIPKEHTQESYLKELCNKGLTKRYADKIDTKLKERLTYELSIICKMGFAGYFLVVWDFINWARNHDIIVGPGRGSVAGSLVAYCLYITDVDPIKHGLIFERFLNPQRISMPDIDTDFEYEKRDQVIDYVVEKYGEDKVASIITFGALKAKAVIRDVGRVLGIPFGEVDKLAKLIPFGPKVTLRTAYDEVKELKELVEGNVKTKQLYELAKKLEGTNRHAGTHAAGLVIGGRRLDELVPLYSDPRTKSTLTQFEGEYLEEVGLLKMDFLGLRNLSVINKCIETLNKSRRLAIDITKIPLDDEKVYKMLKKGQTLGVFQLEGDGVQDLMSKLKPNVFDDIIALIALYRPGPLNSGMVKEFIKRKHNKGKIDYKHELLKPILEETYGVMVYQEQVMEIAVVIGGFSLGKADELRKAMGKKLKSKMDSLKMDFLDGASKKGIKSALAQKLYEHMAEFGEYGFNKSHSAAYAYITYRTAYLKANYPIEYMMSLLACDRDIDKVVEYINEAKRMKINILPPSINRSEENFSIEKDKQGVDKKGVDKIRFGLSAIKNIGHSAIDKLLKERREGQFMSIYDICRRLNTKSLKKVLEMLIKSGAMDEFGCTRATHLSILDEAIERGQSSQAAKAQGQFTLFGQETEGSGGNGFSQDRVIDIAEFSKTQILNYEKEVLGFYFSGHPLDEHNEKIKALNPDKIENLTKLHDGEEVHICGLVYEASHLVSKRGTLWARVILDGYTGSCEVLFFQDSYEEVKDYLQEDIILYVKGKINQSDKKVKLVGHYAKPLDEVDTKEDNNAGSNEKGNSQNSRKRMFAASDSSEANEINNGKILVLENREYGLNNGLDLNTNVSLNGNRTMLSNIAASGLDEGKDVVENGVGGKDDAGEEGLSHQVNIQLKTDSLDEAGIESLNTLKYFCLDNRGIVPILLHIPRNNAVVTVKASSEFNVDAGAIKRLTKLACVERVWLN